MRVPTTPAFSKFLLDNSHYPYNSLYVTRNSFFCKWVMLKGQSHTGIVYFPTLANSYSVGVLREMIRSGEAMPLPLELSQIMDSMRYWRLEEDIHWHNNVVYILSRTLDLGLRHNNRDFVRNLISLQITKLIMPYYDIGTLGFELLYFEWKNWFNARYRIEDFADEFCFRWVSIASFAAMEEMISEVVFGPMNSAS
jgi:hypothetical protein